MGQWGMPLPLNSGYIQHPSPCLWVRTQHHSESDPNRDAPWRLEEAAWLINDEPCEGVCWEDMPVGGVSCRAMQGFGHRPWATAGPAGRSICLMVTNGPWGGPNQAALLCGMELRCPLWDVTGLAPVSVNVSPSLLCGIDEATSWGPVKGLSEPLEEGARLASAHGSPGRPRPPLPAFADSPEAAPRVPTGHPHGLPHRVCGWVLTAG